MDIYKHYGYNPHMKGIFSVIADMERESREWQFVRAQPVTEYEWVAIFSRWVQEETEPTRQLTERDKQKMLEKPDYYDKNPER